MALLPIDSVDAETSYGTFKDFEDALQTNQGTLAGTPDNRITVSWNAEEKCKTNNDGRGEYKIDTENLKNITISYVDFKFTPGEGSSIDNATIKPVYTGQIHFLAGENQNLNITFEHCTFNYATIAVVNNGTESISVIDCEFSNIQGSYAFHKIQSKNITIERCLFDKCSRVAYINAPSSSVESISIIGNTFNSSEREFIQFADHDNYGYDGASIIISGNTVTGGHPIFWLLANVTISGGCHATVSKSNEFGTSDLVRDDSTSQLNETSITPLSKPAIVMDQNQVSMSSSDDDVKIYFTTDGIDPTPSSTPYTSPVTITEDTAFKTIAICNDCGASSEVSSVGFTVEGNNMDQTTTDIVIEGNDGESIPTTKTDTIVTDSTGAIVKEETTLTSDEVQTTQTVIDGETTVTTVIGSSDDLDASLNTALSHIDNLGEDVTTVEIIIKAPVTTEEPAQSIPATVVETLAEAGASLTVESQDAKVNLSNEVLRSANGAEISVESKKTATEDLTPAQQNAVSENAIVISVTMSIGTDDVHELDGGAWIWVAFTHDSVTGAGDIRVTYVDDRGNRTTIMDHRYENGQVGFYTDHFSDFAIELESEALPETPAMPDFIPLPDRPQGGVEVTLPGNETPSEKENNTKIIACAAAAVVAAALALFLVIDTRRP